MKHLRIAWVIVFSPSVNCFLAAVRDLCCFAHSFGGIFFPFPKTTPPEHCKIRMLLDRISKVMHQIFFRIYIWALTCSFICSFYPVIWFIVLLEQCFHPKCNFLNNLLTFGSINFAFCNGNYSWWKAALDYDVSTNVPYHSNGFTWMLNCV